MQLEWSQHSAQLVGAICGLHSSDQSLKDVTLSAQGRQLKAHKLMLAAASDYFRVSSNYMPCQWQHGKLQGIRGGRQHGGGCRPRFVL
jgi:hypothetical protein